MRLVAFHKRLNLPYNRKGKIPYAKQQRNKNIEWASGELGDYFLQYSGEDNLTIQVVGNNKVTFTHDAWQGIRSDGTGDLRITSESDGELLIKGTALKTGIYFCEDLILDGSLKLTCDIRNYDSATGLKSDSGGTLTVEDGVKLFVYKKISSSGSSLELLIMENDMPVNTKTPVISVGIIINEYQYGKNAEDITIKTTKLTDKKVGKKAFKGIHSKATIKVPKFKPKIYKTMLKKKGIGKSVKVKK